jgi:hypothetical protein
MVITIGGCGIWAMVDFFYSIKGNYKDSHGRYVDKKFTKGLAIALLVLFFLSIMSINYKYWSVMFPKTPDSAKNVQTSVDTEEIQSRIELSFHQIVIAEDEYFDTFDRYSTDISELLTVSNLKLDPDVEVIGLQTYSPPSTQRSCLKFTVRHKEMTDISLDYDSCEGLATTADASTPQQGANQAAQQGAGQAAQQDTGQSAAKDLIQAAYQQVAMAEELFNAQRDYYTEDITLLISDANLKLDPNVRIEQLQTYIMLDTSAQCFVFVARHAQYTDVAYKYDSCEAQTSQRDDSSSDQTIMKATQGLVDAEGTVYVRYGEYTNDVAELGAITGYTMPSDITLLKLQTYVHPSKGSCFAFILRHRTNTGLGYSYDSCGSQGPIA